MAELFDLFNYGFMVRALMAGALVGIICPALGTFLVLRRLSLIADTLSHVALAGVAAGIYLKVAPFGVAIGASVVVAIAIEWLRSTGRLFGEAALALFLYAALAVAVVLISLGQGFNANLFGYLFGSIVTVGESDLWLIGGIAVAVVVMVLALYPELMQTAFDQDLAVVSGLRVERVNFLLAALTGVAVALSMRIVGILLVGALMVIPVLSSLQISRGFRMTVLVAVGSGLLSVLSGLIMAYYLGLAAGGAIVLMALGLLVLSLLIKQGRRVVTRAGSAGRSR